MSSSNVLAGPESAPTLQVSHAVVTPTSAPSNMDIMNLSSTIPITYLLSLFTLLVALVCIYWIRRWRTISNMSNERPSEKEAIHDVEALAANHPIIPVTPVADVRWTPQIRSISGPRPDQEAERKPASLFPKRSRSPPPCNLSKARNMLPGLCYPKSAPVHVLSFGQHEMPHSADDPEGALSPPVTPLAVAASGMETRSLGRLGSSSKN